MKHCTQKKHKEVRKHTKDKSQAKLTSFTVSKPEGPSTSTSEPRPLVCLQLVMQLLKPKFSGWRK